MRAVMLRGLMAVLPCLGCSGVGSEDQVRQLKAENAALLERVAVTSSYRCSVVAARELGDDGRLGEAQGLHATAVGSSFVVDRSTGIIAGGVGNNLTYESRSVVYTPPDNRFHVVSISHGPNKSVDFLSVKDWADGPQKPFVLVVSGGVYTGVCEK